MLASLKTEARASELLTLAFGRQLEQIDAMIPLSSLTSRSEE